MTEGAVRLLVNGQAREYGSGMRPASLADLIHSLGLDAGMVVAEVNGDIVGRDQYRQRALADGDNIELVRFVGGG